MRQPLAEAKPKSSRLHAVLARPSPFSICSNTANSKTEVSVVGSMPRSRHYQTSSRFSSIVIHQQSTILSSPANGDASGRHVRSVVLQQHSTVGLKRNIALSEGDVLCNHNWPSIRSRDGGEVQNFRSSVFDTRLGFE